MHIQRKRCSDRNHAIFRKTEEMEEESSSTSDDSPVRRGRPRGRGRPRPVRGRVRGRGGGRGRGREIQEERRDELALRHTQSRTNVAKTHVQNLSHEQCQNLLVGIAARSPSLILDLVDESTGSNNQQSTSKSLSWCTCTRCREMPTDIEKVCCGRQPQHCTTLLPVLVLDEAVLALARLYREDVLALPSDDDFNRGNTYAAYRQYILWTYGRLGAGERKVIPSCCLWKIRDKFPEPSGQYVGFVPGRLG